MYSCCIESVWSFIFPETSLYLTENTKKSVKEAFEKSKKENGKSSQKKGGRNSIKKKILSAKKKKRKMSKTCNIYGKYSEFKIGEKRRKGNNE